MSVYHDVWMPYDFTGHPHPDVHARNAPRLEAAPRDLDVLLGVEGARTVSGPPNPRAMTFWSATPASRW
ncbi:MAG: hypothetical protein ACQSGP_18090 [Frankia sp.]